MPCLVSMKQPRLADLQLHFAAETPGTGRTGHSLPGRSAGSWRSFPWARSSLSVQPEAVFCLWPSPALSCPTMELVLRFATCPGTRLMLVPTCQGVIFIFSYQCELAAGTSLELFLLCFESVVFFPFFGLSPALRAWMQGSFSRLSVHSAQLPRGPHICQLLVLN